MTDSAGVFIAGATVAASASLAAESAQIQITAIVPPNCEIEITRHDASLDLTVGFDNIRVATIMESCNNAPGYAVTLTSSREGVLGQGDVDVPYAIQYGDTEGNLNQPLVIERAAAAFGAQRDLTVSATASSGLPPGTYRDTITVTISAR